MDYARTAIIILIICAIIIVLAPTLAPPKVGRRRRPPSEQGLQGRLRELARQADNVPLYSELSHLRRQREIQGPILEQLPFFWQDIAIYMTEGRRDLAGAIAATVASQDDPLSTTVQKHLKDLETGSGHITLEEALQAAAQELGNRDFTQGIKSLIAITVGPAGMITVLTEMAQYAAAELTDRKLDNAATLPVKLVAISTPLLLMALLIVIAIPIVAFITGLV